MRVIYRLENRGAGYRLPEGHENRKRWDSNPHTQRVSDQQSDALTARPRLQHVLRMDSDNRQDDTYICTLFSHVLKSIVFIVCLYVRVPSGAAQRHTISVRRRIKIYSLMKRNEIEPPPLTQKSECG